MSPFLHGRGRVLHDCINLMIQSINRSGTNFLNNNEGNVDMSFSDVYSNSIVKEVPQRFSSLKSIYMYSR